MSHDRELLGNLNKEVHNNVKKKNFCCMPGPLPIHHPRNAVR